MGLEESTVTTTGSPSFMPTLKTSFPVMPILDSSPCAPYLDAVTVRARTAAEVRDLAECRHLHPRHLCLYLGNEAFSAGATLAAADWVRNVTTLRIAAVEGEFLPHAMTALARELFADAPWPNLRGLHVRFPGGLRRGPGSTDELVARVLTAPGVTALTELIVPRGSRPHTDFETHVTDALFSKLPAGALVAFGPDYQSPNPEFGERYHPRPWWHERQQESAKMRHPWEESDDWA